MTDLIRVFLVDTCQGEFGKALGGGVVEGGRRGFGSETNWRKQNQRCEESSHCTKCNQSDVELRLQTPGSMRVSRVGFGVSPKRSFFRNDGDRVVERDKEVRDRETRSPTRETRALPPRHRRAIALSVGADKFRAQQNAGYGFTKTFLNPIIITAHLRAARSNANRCYSWFR